MSQNGAILHSETFSIVAVGKFNPAIFQPFWLAENNLIRREEAETANIELISDDVSIITVAWFSLQVTTDRFVLESLDPANNLATRDLALGIFRVLEHTPVNAVGLNLSKHYKLKDETAWHQFGDYYAPKTTWNSIIEQAGMNNLTIVGSVENGAGEIPVRIVLQPSKKPSQFGAKITINHHHSNNNQELNASDFIHVVSSNFDFFLKHVGKTTDKLLTDYINAEKR